MRIVVVHQAFLLPHQDICDRLALHHLRIDRQLDRRLGLFLGVINEISRADDHVDIVGKIERIGRDQQHTRLQVRSAPRHLPPEVLDHGFLAARLRREPAMGQHRQPDEQANHDGSGEPPFDGIDQACDQ